MLEIGAPRNRQQALDKVIDQKSDKTLIVALDDRSISGIKDAEVLRDPKLSARIIGRSGVNAVLGFAAMFSRYRADFEDVAAITNLTLSLEGPNHLNKVRFGTVRQTVDIGAEMASVHLNTTNEYEPGMLRNVAEVSEDCDKLKVPWLLHGYPRRIVNGREDHYMQLRAEQPDKYADLVEHVVCVGADAGADIIKVPWTGEPKGFERVTSSAYEGQKVVMAGGPAYCLKSRPMMSMGHFLRTSRYAMESGAGGIAVGRNYFLRPRLHAELVLRALSLIVHNEFQEKQALDVAESDMVREVPIPDDYIGWREEYMREVQKVRHQDAGRTRQSE